MSIDPRKRYELTESSAQVAPDRKPLDLRFRELLRSDVSVPPPRRVQHTSAGAPEKEPSWVFNAPRDQVYAAPEHPIFSQVLSVFTQEWVGIRAASGSLPGKKLAVSKDMVWSSAELRRVCDLIDRNNITCILAQGASFATLDLLAALRAELPSLKIVGVWHGTLAAWAYDEERRLANRFLELASVGVFDRVSLMRRGMHGLHPKATPYLVPNMPPMVNIRRLGPPRSGQKLTCLFGSWNNHWKNMYANVVAAALSERVGKVLCYAPVELPAHLSAKIERVSYDTREAHFRKLSLCDLVLNATVVDCHPMVELEALAVGTPTLRGELDLDFGHDHPFCRLMTVSSVHDPIALRDQIDRISMVPGGELADIVADYRRLVVVTSLERYARLFEDAQ
jgi:hypothetical protein